MCQSLGTCEIVGFILAVGSVCYYYGYKIWYVNRPEIYEKGVKWPDWMIKDAEEYNRKHPDKKVDLEARRK